MSVISLFKIKELPKKLDLVYRIDGRKRDKYSFMARPSKYNENEIEIMVWYKEDVETGLKRAFSDEASKIISIFKENGREQVLRKVFAFVNLENSTLEIYRGIDNITIELKDILQDFLKTDLTSVSLNSGQLLKIIQTHSNELKQAMFKYIHGLWYHIIRGTHLENNNKYKTYLETKQDSLRVISVLPKIKYINGNEYMVTINGDRGTIRMSNGYVKWKPRAEIRQIVSLVDSVFSF